LCTAKQTAHFFGLSLTHPLRLEFRSLFAGSKEEAVALHPSSVLGGGADINGNFLVFHERIKTSQVQK
jgi:hypothetical protein